MSLFCTEYHRVVFPYAVDSVRSSFSEIESVHHCIIMLLSLPVSCFRQSVDTQKFAAHFTLHKPRRLSSRRQQKSASERKGSDRSGVLRFIIFDNA